MHAKFAIPGDLSSPTGGYGYARRLLRDGPGRGLELDHVALPDGFPFPSPEALAETERRLRTLPADVPVLIDGLAFGALPIGLVSTIPAPVAALCHHPLAMEAGLAPELASHLRQSETQALGMAAHVITTSHATAAILTQSFGISGERLTVAPPGTDPAPRATGSDGPDCKILSVGSVTKRKGHDRLIRALATHRDLPWTLRIVGARPDPRVEAELAQQIARLDLQSRVTIDGPLSVSALTAAYQQADLFALASGFEGYGMAFVEAMAHGLPVVGIDVPAVAEATAGAAQLMPEGELAMALGQLIANENDRDALADKCWTAAQTFLRWPETATIVAEALARAANQGAHR